MVAEGRGCPVEWQSRWPIQTKLLWSGLISFPSLLIVVSGPSTHTQFSAISQPDANCRPL